MVAAGHSATHRHHGESVAISMNVAMCQVDTTNVNVANDTYERALRSRSRTDAPIAMISSAASSAETAWTFTDRR